MQVSEKVGHFVLGLLGAITGIILIPFLVSCIGILIAIVIRELID